MKRGIFLIFAVVLTCGVLAKDKFLEKPFKKWSAKETQQVLVNSPWAKQQVFSAAYGTKGGTAGGDNEVKFESDTLGSSSDRGRTGVKGEKELFDSYTIRLFTALPIREAHVRAIQIASGYDSKPPEERDKFDVMTQRALNMDTSDKIIVAIDFTTNNKDHLLNVEKGFTQLDAKQLQQGAYLISQRLGRVQILEYYPPSPDKTGLKMIFPRTVNGQPVISAEDKEITFEWYHDNKVLVTFPVRDLMYNGKLEF